MILLDFSNIIVGSIMVANKIPDEEKTSHDFIRHLVLNSIRNYRIKYKKTYGEIVVCTDTKSSWRKGVYPYYKAHRKAIREKQKSEKGMDWSVLFKTIHEIIDEIDTFFPYKVISIPHAEGDDVIAVLARNFQEKSIIISSDKDFTQLHKYKNIKQYSPIQKKMLNGSEPYKYLKEHIIRGDKGDGVPNILSADDCIVEGVRQRPISKKKVELWMNEKPADFCVNGMSEKWKRNQQLIDFDFIPTDISQSIVDQYLKEKDQRPGQLLNYFITKRLKYLMENMEDFIK
jgi:5'-3' exonuclease